MAPAARPAEGDVCVFKASSGACILAPGALAPRSERAGVSPKIRIMSFKCPGWEINFSPQSHRRTSWLQGRPGLAPADGEGSRQQGLRLREGDRKASGQRSPRVSRRGPNAPAPVPAAPLTTGVCWRRRSVAFPSRLQAFRFGGGRGLRCPQSVSTLWALGPALETTAEPSCIAQGTRGWTGSKEERLPTVPGGTPQSRTLGQDPAGGAPRTLWETRQRDGDRDPHTGHSVFSWGDCAGLWPRPPAERQTPGLTCTPVHLWPFRVTLKPSCPESYGQTHESLTEL